MQLITNKWNKDEKLVIIYKEKCKKNNKKHDKNKVLNNDKYEYILSINVKW